MDMSLPWTIRMGDDYVLHFCEEHRGFTTSEYSAATFWQYNRRLKSFDGIMFPLLF
jgi:hypothetical protein